MGSLSIPIMSEGIRIAAHSAHRRAFGWKRHSGDARAICKSIVTDCWNGQFFQASSGHFRQFYARDFGWCVDALMRQGYAQECKQTLAYALDRYTKARRITVAVTPSGRPFDFPDVYSPDSVAFFFKSLLSTGDEETLIRRADFLQKEIDKFASVAMDPETGLARRGAHFSSLKDYAIRDGSCYDSTMIALMAETVKKMKMFENPFKGYNFGKEIVKNYWTGSYFKDAVGGPEFISGDANVFPFALRIIDDDAKLKKAIKSMKEAGLDHPFPLRYEPEGVRSNQIWEERVVPAWERTAHWAHQGLYYIDLLGRVDKKAQKETLEKYKQLIERHGTLFECYTSDGMPYRSLMYHADEGMLWAAKMIDMARQRKGVYIHKYT